MDCNENLTVYILSREKQVEAQYTSNLSRDTSQEIQFFGTLKSGTLLPEIRLIYFGKTNYIVVMQEVVTMDLFLRN